MLRNGSEPDLVCLGIGVNGHIAFNDPPADFSDPALVQVVTLDHASRVQQVDDGCFNALDEVPTQAVTLTNLTNAYALNATMLRAVELVAESVMEPPLWRSGCAPGCDEANGRFLARFRDRVRKL